MALNILITNDDGVEYDGLLPLVKWAKKLGHVTVVAPKHEQSGKSHGIELHKSFEIKHFNLLPDVVCYSVDSTPADCIRYAVLGLKEKFDLVISGINNGLNIGADMIYSGTVAAVFEAALHGIKAIAVSADYSKHLAAADHLDTVYRFIEENHLLEKHGIYNINIPDAPRGFRVTMQGGPYYSDDFEERENSMFMPIGKCVYEAREDDLLDTDAVMHGYISVTPLTVNRVDMNVYHDIVKLNS